MSFEIRESIAPGSEADEKLDQLCVNTIRTLSMDAVQQANSGHPGTAMAMAPVIYTLWQRFLRFDPDDPIWPNRDHLHRSEQARVARLSASTRRLDYGGQGPVRDRVSAPAEPAWKPCA